MKFICLDIETTGFDSNRDKIIEFAIAKFDEKKLIDTFSHLTNPGIPIPPIVKAITNIQDEDLIGKKPFTEYIDQIQDFIEDLPIMGHNISFDTGFLRSQKIPINNPEIDTLELSTLLIKNQASYSLESLCQSFKIAHVNKHRALDDVMANIDLFRIFLKEIEKIPAAKLSEICYYLSKSNWGSKELFFEILKKRKAEPKPFILPLLKIIKEKEEPISSLPSYEEGKIAQIFQDEGSMADVFKEKHETRDCQSQMAQLVWDAFQSEENLICEAGTGTGKTLAYAIPSAIHALKNDQKVVIATYTTTLQDQLSEKDIPLAKKVLEHLLKDLKNPPKLVSTVLKGRNHYLSIERLKKVLDKPFFETHEIIALTKILLWLPKTKTGEKWELNLRNKENLIWNDICCTEDLCPHDRKSAHYPCYLLKSRAKAKKANIIVTNHALLLKDCLADTPIIPNFNHLIIDEAHNLETTALDAFSTTLNFSCFEPQIDKLLRLNILLKHVSSDQLNIFNATNLADDISKITNNLSSLSSSVSIGFGLIGIFLSDHMDPYSQYKNAVIIDEYKVNEPKWQQVKESFNNIHLAIKDIIKDTEKLLEKLEKNKDILPKSYKSDELFSALHRLISLNQDIERIFIETPENLIKWANTSRDGTPYVKACPMNVAPYLQTHLYENKKSTIITSATLSVQHNFDYIKSQIGLTENAKEVILPSPFYYSEQSKIIIASDMPEPMAPGHINAITDTLKSIFETKKGRILVLLTSKATVTAVYQKLHGFCKEREISLLAQGVSGGRGKILQNFQISPGNSIILGLNSFWEGVDLPGDMLTTVIIQKLPFDPPFDPLQVAREQLTENSFFNYAVPRAILKFKQGFGRLIRSTKDEGILIVLDSRITTKSYGRIFLESLPEGIPIEYIEREKIEHYI